MYSEIKGKRHFPKGIVWVLMLLLLWGSLTGCGSGTDTSDTVAGSNIPGTADGSGISEGSQAREPEQPESENESAFPGSYTVPEGWVKAEQYSTVDKVFYVEEGHEEDDLPDNISIEIGTNRYAAEEHEQFRDAIVRQLLVQLQGVEAELTGDGTYTEQGYVVYIFTISGTDALTKQYYIVGDQQYCLIHLTGFSGSESTVQAAQDMADSFVWD